MGKGHALPMQTRSPSQKEYTPVRSDYLKRKGVRQVGLQDADPAFQILEVGDRSFAESRFNHDFSRIPLHTNSSNNKEIEVQGPPESETTGSDVEEGVKNVKAAEFSAEGRERGDEIEISGGSTEELAETTETNAGGDSESGPLQNPSDLALIDFELAEHQRWANSFGEMGTAGSDQRARFLMEQAGEGAVSGAVGGAGMAFAMGAISAGVGHIVGQRLATLAVSRGATVTPIPGLGPAIGGVMAVAGLAMRDWGATSQTIGRIGTGEGYEGLANDLEGIAELLDVATQVMDVLAGILGGIAVGMWVATVLSAGTLSPLALSLSAIATGIGFATTAIGVIINTVVRPTVTALRALHTFESQGDPGQIEAEGQQLQAAAGQITGAVVGHVAGKLGGAAGEHLGARADRAVTRWQASRTGGSPEMRAHAGPGPRLHVEVPEGPTRADAETGPSLLGTSESATPIAMRPASAEGPAAASPLSTLESSGELVMHQPSSETDTIRLDVLTEFAEQQRLPSGAPLGEPELGNLPGPLESHLHWGERDPGSYEVPPAARSQVGEQARIDAMANLREAVESGIDTPRTAASRETLTADTLIALTDPNVRMPDADELVHGATRSEVAQEADRSVEASHVPGVVTEPHEAHTGTNVEILPKSVHREGIHSSDTTRPLETAFPNPEYEGRAGFQSMGGRAPPNPQSDLGYLWGAEQDAAHLERNFPSARQSDIDKARLWLSERRAELHAAEASNFETPPTGPSASMPNARSSIETDIEPVPRSGTAASSVYESNTETVRTSDRVAAMAQYHDQIRADPGRESGVWRDANGNYYVMQGDSGSVAPPSVHGPLELIYHSHPTEMGAARQGLMSQPSQAGGDIGVLQYQHGQGTPGKRQSSELHFPVYDRAGVQTGYGTTQFAYDPTHPLPLQVQTTLPGGRPSIQRYASFADYGERTGIRAGGATSAESQSTRILADIQLSRDTAAAQQRIEAIVAATRTPPTAIPGERVGRELGRKRIINEAQGESSSGRSERGPAYTASVAGIRPGEAIEIPINPAYPEPPGTRAELDLLLERARATQEAQTDLRGTERSMRSQAEQQQAHNAHLEESQTIVQGLAAGRSNHQAAVDSTQNTNTEQQSTAGDAISNLGRGAQETTALYTLIGSLRVFQGLAHLFSYLPGDLGRRAEGARNDSSRLITTLNRVSDMQSVQSSVEGGRNRMAADAERIGAVSAEGQQTDAELSRGQDQVVGLQQANAESLSETESVLQQATQERTDAATGEKVAQTAHDDLQSRLQAWAQAHRQARESAIQRAVAQYSQLGYRVREE